MMVSLILLHLIIICVSGNVVISSSLFSKSKGQLIDHNDPSKPLHRLTNGPEPLKTIESDGSNIKKPS